MQSHDVMSLAQANDIDEVAGRLRQSGVTVVTDVLSPSECEHYKSRLEEVLEERIRLDSYCGNEQSQVLDNYFLGNADLVQLLYQEVTDKLMRHLIDDDYVLISPSARNRRCMPGREFGRPTSGVGWHTDTRFLQGGQGVRPSLSYMAILCVDEFSSENGATDYIPASHLRYQRPPDRDAELPHLTLEAPQGAVIFLDTALWHRVGEASEASRWGVFNTFGPWFMKPYHRFDKMFDDEQFAKFDPIVRQLLHLDSIVPADHNERMATLRRVGL